MALVDGNIHQVDRIEAEAKDRGADITIVVDLVHVLEYLWAAVWCFFAEGDPAARDVATGIKRRARAGGLAKNKRLKADACATYLTNKADYLDYPTALAEGWPIASGVIEGTCRYPVADRMDITGARWSVIGAAGQPGNQRDGRATHGPASSAQGHNELPAAYLTDSTEPGSLVELTANPRLRKWR